MFKKQKPHTKPHIGCLNCGGGEMRGTKDKITISMKTRMYNYFGGWHIEKDGETVYRGVAYLDFEEYPTLMKFENMARKDPNRDWRAVLYLPLSGSTYQRQGKNEWVLIDSNLGFA